ncbi:MAG TPA: L,D-transpeptidase [Thermomicrobiaceae bacterium]|nr:L,D-transpeptidase [Thermomicrobiaceae bacterium]
MRRVLVMIPAFLLVLASLMPSTVAAAAAAPPVPYDTGPSAVFFPQTGHSLGLGFLDYWRANGDVTAFGYPVTEEFQQNGITVQYFQRAVFEYHPEADPANRVQVRLLGSLAAPAAANDYLANQIHLQYVASFFQMDLPTSDPFAPVAPVPQNGDHDFFSQTGHSLNYAFKNYWEMWGGITVFGYPISEEFPDPSTGLTVQYFERAVFEFHPNPTDGQLVTLRQLGVTAAQQAGVNTSAVAQGANVPVYSAGLWQRNLSIAPDQVTTPPPGAPFGETKWIEVDLTQQYLRAWDGRTMVFGTYISSGLDPNATPTGYFSVYEKLPFDEMKGGTPGTPDFYDLKNVPNVMYFLAGGYAIHGAYWHWNFGQRVSHGCVNEPLDSAAWMYSWTPMGTVVWVHN